MEDRQEHGPCPLMKKCGGCQMQHIPYEKQLLVKQGRVQGLLSRYCRVEKSSA